jgi:hypothetical protein
LFKFLDKTKIKFRMNKKIKLLLLSILFATFAFAQVGKMETDRPDQTESPFIVPKKWVQIEAGFTATTLKNGFVEFLTPSILSKYGITKKTELRLITQVEGTNKKIYEIGVAEINTPLQIGFKTAFFEEKGLRPKTTFIAHVALQNINYNGIFETRNTKELSLNFRFTMQNSITEKISLGYNLGMEWEQMNEQPSYVYTFAPGFTLSPKWYTYIEAFGFITKNESPQHNIDGGFAYSVNDNFKLDISSGFGVTKASPKWYFALGGSVRFGVK